MLHQECCSPALQPRHLLGAFDWYLLHRPQYSPQHPMRSLDWSVFIGRFLLKPVAADLIETKLIFYPKS
jgi:hypothetical protein